VKENTDIGRIKVGQYEKIIRIGRLCPVLAELFYLYYYGSFHHIKQNVKKATENKQY
jgi:hypothetical protein